MSLVGLTFARGREGLDQQIWHQIEIDVPRTRPGVQLWMYRATQRVSGCNFSVYPTASSCICSRAWNASCTCGQYGIRPVAMCRGSMISSRPSFKYFSPLTSVRPYRLSPHVAAMASPLSNLISSNLLSIVPTDSDPESFDPSLLPESVLDAIEADSFWCLSRLLDGIQDNYISAQPGIQRSVRRMSELVARIDAPLHEHLAAQNVEFIQFAFRWMNCLLMREISVKNTIRMWDTYLVRASLILLLFTWLARCTGD